MVGGRRMLVRQGLLRTQRPCPVTEAFSLSKRSPYDKGTEPGRCKSGVVAQRPDVADVVVQALEL